MKVLKTFVASLFTLCVLTTLVSLLVIMIPSEHEETTRPTDMPKVTEVMNNHTSETVDEEQPETVEEEQPETERMILNVQTPSGEVGQVDFTNIPETSKVGMDVGDGRIIEHAWNITLEGVPCEVIVLSDGQVLTHW